MIKLNFHWEVIDSWKGYSERMWRTTQESGCAGRKHAPCLTQSTAQREGHGQASQASVLSKRAGSSRKGTSV